MTVGDDELAESIERALIRPRWRGFDPVLHGLFEERVAQVDRPAVQQGIRAAVASFISFGSFDLWLFPDVGLRSFLVRVLVGLTILAIVEIQVARRVDLRLVNMTCAASVFSAGAAWILAARTTQHQESFVQFLSFGTIFVISSSLFFRFRFRVSAACSTALTVLFCVAVLPTAVGFETKIVAVSYFVVFLSFALYLSWELAFERYATFLNQTQARLNEKAVREKGRQLALIASTDHLTGLRNRRAVVAEYADYRERWMASERPIGLLLIDVDHFKSFNDCYGHQRGDDCLVAVGQALERAAAGRRAIVGRYGGEEFVAFCHVEDEAALDRFAEEMRRSVEMLELSYGDRTVAPITVSVGASMTRPDSSPDLDRLSSEADRALYLAKENGRNRSRRFDPDAPDSEAGSRALVELLTRAVEDDLLSLNYQPIVALESGCVCAMEALMRLRDADGAPISPATFIPVAERTGLIIELGRWALRQACTEILVAGVADQVSVNVSAVQLRSPGFPLYVARLLGELGLRPASLALEVTEGIDISSDANILEAIRSLKALGVQIWLDDFGTGYAGLQWLQVITFDVVKVDRCFLDHIETDEGRLFLQDVLHLLHNRNLRILVEGVETREQLGFVRAGGVAMAQGYFLGRPQPAKTAAACPKAQCRV